MPRRYERIRDSYIRAGKSVKQAKRLAAMTYNKTRKPGEPKLSSSHKRKVGIKR